MTPELRFAHWLRGYLDAHLARSTSPLDPLPAADVVHIRQALQFATGDMVQLGRDPQQKWRELSPHDFIGQVYGGTAQENHDKAQADANRLANVFACQGQTIPTMQEQMQKNEIRPKRDPDCPAHDTRCHPGQCYFQKAEAMGVSYRPKGVA